MAKSSSLKEIPMCICGHDIFYHDIRINPQLTNYMIDNIREHGEPTEVVVGKCNENNGNRYTCKCKRFNSIDIWMNQLWEEMKQYEIV
jgi:hypothetical protein